jgi:hypothetical protein
MSEKNLTLPAADPLGSLRALVRRAYIPAFDNYAILRFPINLEGYHALDLEEETVVWRNGTPTILTIGTRIVRHISELVLQPAIHQPAGD